MKLILLQPPIEDFYDTDIRLQPIGLGYLKATVKRFLPQIQVVVKDYHQGGGVRTVPWPPEFAYLKDYYPGSDQSPFSAFQHYYHFGVSFETLAEQVVREKPDLVGISSLFSAYHREVLRSAEAIKALLPVPILVGGSHVSAAPLSLLRHPCVDFVIIGEGERPLVSFLKTWEKGGSLEGIPNLGFKRNGETILNPTEPNFPIEDIPLPDLSDFPPHRYRYEKRPLTFLITSRGCPHQCSFCSVQLTFGHQYRRRSDESVLREICQRYEEGFRVFDFEDDNLTFNVPAAKALFQKL